MVINSLKKKILITVCAVLFFGLFLWSRGHHGQFASAAFKMLPWIEELRPNPALRDGRHEVFSRERELQQLPVQESTATSSVEVPIFVYHSVRPYEPEPKEIDDFDITPELLERQLQYLKDNGFATISLDVLVDHFTKDKPLPPKSVILTFDDGWENQYTYAFPLLKKYQDTATFFVFTNAIDYHHFLTWQEIEEMHKSGMEIGSHTKSHPYLSKLSTDALRQEIFESKKILENHLGIRITAFATPFGYSSDVVTSLIGEAGYTSGRTLYRGVYHTKGNLLKLRSVLISDDFEEFKRMLKRD